ncbi:zinc-binding dehydrogenase [Paraburkholderia terrae]
MLQIAKLQGFRTINLVRREEQVAEIQCAWRRVVLCTADEGWPDQLKKAAGDGGIVSAIDCVAGRTGATIARQLAVNGRLLVYGALSSHRQTDPVAFEMPVFARRSSIQVLRCATGSSSRGLHARGSEGSQTLSSLLDRMAEGSVKPPPARCYHVDRAHEAFTAAESVAHDAKPLLAFAER